METRIKDLYLEKKFLGPEWSKTWVSDVKRAGCDRHFGRGYTPNRDLTIRVRAPLWKGLGG